MPTCPSHLHIIKELRIAFIIPWRADSIFLKSLQNILIINRQIRILLIEQLLTFQINLIALVMRRCLFHFIFELEYKRFEGLPFDFCESIVYWRELLLILGFLYQSKISLEVPLISFPLWQIIIPRNQQIVKHQLRYYVKHILDGELNVCCVSGQQRVHVVVVDVGL